MKKFISKKTLSYISIVSLVILVSGFILFPVVTNYYVLLAVLIIEILIFTIMIFIFFDKYVKLIEKSSDTMYVIYFFFLLAFFIIYILLFFFMFFIFFDKYVKPIDNSSDTMDKLLQGNYHARVHHAMNGTIGELNMKINSLARNLSELTIQE